MSINNIRLNLFQVASMFKDSLVETNEVQQSIAKVEVGSIEKKEFPKIDSLKEWKYLGDHKKNILLIVKYDNTTYLPDEQLNFITSVLSACKLSLGDAAIVNIAKAPSSTYKDVQEKFKSSFIILFGFTPQEFEMPVNFPEFQVQPFNNCTFLYAPSLENLEADKVLKSKLWVCLKRMFEI